MPVTTLTKDQYVRIISVESTLRENSVGHDLIKNSVGTVHKVNTSADGLAKCILEGLPSIIYLYEDLEAADFSEYLPKGGLFNVENLVC